MSIIYSLILKTHKNIFDNEKVVVEEFYLYLISKGFNLVKKKRKRKTTYTLVICHILSKEHKIIELVSYNY